MLSSVPATDEAVAAAASQTKLGISLIILRFFVAAPTPFYSSKIHLLNLGLWS
jgi:hypothetical protein